MLPAADWRLIGVHPDRTDSDGIPAARVTYTLSENSKAMLEHGAARAREVLEAGAVEVLDPGNENMSHLMGTARMGNDPRRSVVNGWNQAHDVPNLFVVDGGSSPPRGARTRHPPSVRSPYGQRMASGNNAVSGLEDHSHTGACPRAV